MTDAQRTIEIYDKQAASLAAQYDAAPSHCGSAALRHLIPTAEKDGLALDVGAGTGRDAEHLTDLGYETVAVEPAAGMRAEGQRRHPSERIRWLDDRLPSLSQTHRMGLLFDVVLLAAVWQHIAPADRARAFRKLITLMKPGGLLLMTLRRGPSPPDRPMHPVSLGEIESLARSHGIEVVRAVNVPDELGRHEIE